MRTTHTARPYASTTAKTRTVQVLLTTAALLSACSTDPAPPVPSAADAASLADAASVRDAEASPTDVGLAAPDRDALGARREHALARCGRPHDRRRRAR